MQETWVLSLGWEDPLEEGMATYSSTLAWRIPWTEEPGGLQSMESQKSWIWLSDTHTHTHTHTHTEVCVIGRQDRNLGLEGKLAFCFFSMQWPVGDSMLWACSWRLQTCRDLLLSKTDGRTGMTVLSFTSTFKWMGTVHQPESGSLFF